MQALCLKKTILITSVSNFELRCEISSTVQNSSYIFRKTNFYMLTQGEVSKFESTLSTVQNLRYMSRKKRPQSPLSTLSTTIFRCPLRLTFLNMLNSVKNQIKRKRLQSPLSTILTTIFRCQLWCEVSRQKSNNYVVFSAKRVINIQNSP